MIRQLVMKFVLRLEMLTRKGAFEQRAEQFRTSRRVILLDVMNSVAGNALKIPSINLLGEAN